MNGPFAVSRSPAGLVVFRARTLLVPSHMSKVAALLAGRME